MRQEIFEQITNKFSSSNQAGKLFLTFADGKEQEPTIFPISSNSSDKMWVELNQMVQETILTSHQISSPELLGIQVPGSLGSSEHLEAQDHFQNLVIKPAVTELREVFQRLLMLRDGKPSELVVTPFTMVTMADTKPIETVNVNKTETVGEVKDETIN